MRAIAPIFVFLFLFLRLVLEEEAISRGQLLLGLGFAVFGLFLFNFGLGVGLSELGAQVGERQYGEPDAWSRAGRCVRRAGARPNLRDEPVSTPRQRFHEPGIVRIVTERGAEPLHGGVQAVVEVDERAVRPQAAAQLLARDHVARALEHHLEDFERLFLEAHGGLAVAELPGSDIELERSEPER